MVFDKKPVMDANQTELVRRINDNTRRVRMIEQNIDVINTRIKGIEERVINDMDSLKKKLDELFLDIGEVSKSLNEVRGEILKINKNLDKTARKTEIKELEGLLELYNPIKSRFITRDEVERLLEEKVNKR